MSRTYVIRAVHPKLVGPRGKEEEEEEEGSKEKTTNRTEEPFQGVVFRGLINPEKARPGSSKDGGWPTYRTVPTGSSKQGRMARLAFGSVERTGSTLREHVIRHAVRHTLEHAICRTPTHHRTTLTNHHR
eukprot:7226631-Prymnesium_polylepis.1